MLFDNAPSKIRNFVLIKTIHLKVDDIIILYFIDETYFWLITNNQLVIFQEQNINYIDFLDINKVSVPEQLFKREIEKLELNFLLIQTEKGLFNLRVEKKTWPLVLKLLQFVKS